MIKKLLLLFFLITGFKYTYYGSELSPIDSILIASNAEHLRLPEKIKIAEEIIIQYTSDSTNLIKAYSNLGSIYLTHSLYKEAIKNFEQSNRISKKLNKKSSEAFNYYFLGNTFIYLNELEKAQNLYKLSSTIFKELQDYPPMGMVHNSQGILFLKKKEYNLAYQAFFKSYRIFDSLNMDYAKSYPLTNIGDYFLKTGEPDSAIFYLNQTLDLNTSFKEYKGEAIALGNIGLAYKQKKEYNKAISFFTKSLLLAEKHQYNKVIYDNYLDLSETYKLKNDFKNSLTYFEKYHSLKDSIVGSETKEGIADMQTNYENERKEKELLLQKSTIESLEASKKINQLKNYITLCCFFGLLISSVFIVLRLRNNLKKKHLEEALIKTQLQLQENESERLEIELKKTNKDLTDFALDIARKNEFTQDIDLKLKQLKKNTSADTKEVLLQELIFKTHNHLKTNEDFERFQSNIKKVNHAFFEKLTSQFGNLTQNEIHLCGLIRLGLTIKDIASIKNISPKSVEMNRYRLRKKLAIKEGDDLFQLLINV